MTVKKAVVPFLLALLAGGAWAEAPLTTTDVVRFLKAGISETTILTELQNRGFGEPLGMSAEAALQEAGATETLVVAIRRVAPKTGPPPTPAPPPTAPPGTVMATDLKAPTYGVVARTVRVPVSVLTSEGKPVLGLRDADFKLSENGKKQGVTLFSGERRPLRLALALDLSRSMDNKIRQVEEALRHFIDLLEPNDEVLVMTFSDRLRIAQDFTSDRKKLMRVLDNLEPDGGTALYDAAFEAIRRVGQGPAESKAVVLVTDGVDTSSSVAFKDVKELARRREVPVFSIGLDSGSEKRGDSFSPHHRPGGGGGFPPGGGGGGRGGFPGGSGGGRPPMGGRPGGGGSRRGFDDKPLTELADETGGRAEIVKGLAHYTPDSDVPGNDELKAAVETIAVILRHRYLLGYEPPDGKSGWREIRVDVDRPDVVARTRKGYYSGG
jgi:VWFA-related protein